MEKNKQNLWKPAVMVFSEISTWIAIPVILAVILGKFLDKKYDTAPWLLLGSAALAFVVSSFGIVRSVKKYAVLLKQEENKK